MLFTYKGPKVTFSQPCLDICLGVPGILSARPSHNSTSAGSGLVKYRAGSTRPSSSLRNPTLSSLFCFDTLECPFAMESWRGHNYYTTNPAKWVELMNLSTSEWNIGPLPPNVVAIFGPLDASYNIPPGSLVIENASQANAGSRDTEKVIFGATSGLVILWALAWFFWHLWKRTLFLPRGSKHPLSEEPDGGNTFYLDGETVADGSTLELGAIGNGFIPASRFKAELEIYYENVRTELEMYEKKLGTDDVVPEDVEAGTELLRRRYLTQLGIYGMQNAHEVTQTERDQMAEKSDALLADFRKLVASWSGQQNIVGWSEEEREELRQLMALLKATSENRHG
jgi:hypothetical protein